MQGLVRAEDLIDVDRQVLARTQAVDPAPQLAAVTPGIGQAVNVVDAQAIHQVFLDQLEDLGVGGFEHGRAFDPQAPQFIDVEETPPIDVIGRGAPAGQTVALLFQQLMQTGEAAGLARVVALQVGVDGLAH